MSQFPYRKHVKRSEPRSDESDYFLNTSQSPLSDVGPNSHSFGTGLICLYKPSDPSFETRLKAVESKVMARVEVSYCFGPMSTERPQLFQLAHKKLLETSCWDSRSLLLSHLSLRKIFDELNNNNKKGNPTTPR